MQRVQNKVALVTGGASGIGRASAHALAAEGARVVVADINEEGARNVAKAIGQAGGEATARRVDLADIDSVRSLVEWTAAEQGGLHVLLNNAALTSATDFSRDQSILDLEVGDWDRSQAINLRGAVFCCKHAIPHLLEAGGGSVINMSSNQALSGDVQGLSYAAAKAGMASITRTLATAFGKQNVRFNCISPGLIMSETAQASCPPVVVDLMEKNNLLPRVGLPEDVASLVVYLASDESSFITGQILRVDGGQLSHLPHFAQMRELGVTTTEE